MHLIRLLFVLLMVSLVRHAVAQEDVFASIASETCNCLAAKNLSRMSKPEVDMATRACMLERALNYNLGLDFSDQVVMEKFSEKVGIHMAEICPDRLHGRVGTVVPSLAQEDVLASIAGETCNCLAAKNLVRMSKPEVDMATRACMLERALNYELGLDFSDQVVMQKFSEKVGHHMAEICPDRLHGPIGSIVPSADDSTEEIKVTGIIKSVKLKEFVFMTLRDDKGMEHSMVWIRYFPGSDSFVSNPKAMAGRRATVTYLPTIYFSPRNNGYFSVKEIVNLSLESNR